MYGGKRVSVGDQIFLFASENEGGCGLFRTRDSDIGRRSSKKTRS